MRGGSLIFRVARAALMPILALVATMGHASDALRCGSKLVTEGDTRTAVRNLCGEPADIDYSTLMRLPSVMHHGRLIVGHDLVEVQVETWTYNFGPNKLMRRLKFVDGRLEDIETLGYGYNDPP